MRLVGLLALVALLQPLPTSMLFGDEAGRIFSRCVQLCGAIEAICKDNCQPTCAAMFPGDEVAFDACVIACTETCAGPKEACKKQCNADKAATTRH